MRIVAWLAGLTAVVLAGCLGNVALAQSPPTPTPAPVKKIFTRSPQFRLPFNLDDSDRVKLREVSLYVKTGAEPWACKETASPQQSSFTFRAPRDGEYGFTIVVVDKAGNATPADITLQAPGLVVIVDTEPPEIDVQPPASAAEVPMFRCDVKDANPDPSLVKLEYERPDRTWRLLEAVWNSGGMYRFPGAVAWPDETEWTGRIRASAADRAGNVGVRDFTFKPGATTTGTTVARTETKVGKPVAQPSFASEPTPPAQASVGKQVINSTHAALEYHIDQLGPSGIGKVEVWLTKDGGQGWARWCDDPDRKTPVEFDLPGEGLFGVKLVVSNGNGVSEPTPKPGDAPDCWIEVDTTKPIAQLLAARPGTGADSGSLMIFYTANDRNLGPEPIHLFYATSHEGPWLPIARGARNDGVYRWSVPREAGPELFFRLEVIDLAGNVARCELAEKVVMDMSRPKARVIGVSAGTNRVLPPLGN
jgi:hypothetical protein